MVTTLIHGQCGVGNLRVGRHGGLHCTAECDGTVPTFAEIESNLEPGESVTANVLDHLIVIRK